MDKIFIYAPLLLCQIWCSFPWCASGFCLGSCILDVYMLTYMFSLLTNAWRDWDTDHFAHFSAIKDWKANNSWKSSFLQLLRNLYYIWSGLVFWSSTYQIIVLHVSPFKNGLLYHSLGDDHSNLYHHLYHPCYYCNSLSNTYLRKSLSLVNLRLVQNATARLLIRSKLASNISHLLFFVCFIV